MDKCYMENEKKHVTTCIMTNHPTVTDKLMKKGAAFAGMMTTAHCNKTDASKFVGIAKCHELDTPNTTTGHHISSSRADLAYHRALAKDLKDVKEALLEEIAIIEALEKHESKMIDKTKAFIEVLKK